MDRNSEKKINYRELQAIAKKMQLPGNLKHNLLLEIVQARKDGNEELVDRILSEQKLERAKRRSEKLEAKEAAYKHLNIFQEKRAQGRAKKISQEPAPEIIHKVKQNSVQDNYLRSLLALPHKSLRELLKQETSARTTQQHIRDPRIDRTVYCNQHIGQHMAQSSNQQYINPEVYSNAMRIDNDFANKYRPNNSIHRYANKQNFNEENIRNLEIIDNIGNIEYKSSDPRRSFQMRDILNGTETNTSCQYHMPPPASVMNVNQFIPEVQNFLPSSGQDLTAYLPIYPNTSEYWSSPFQEVPLNNHDHYWRRFPDTLNYTNNSANTSGRYLMEHQFLSTPNSDTMSANEPEFEHLAYPEPFPDFRSNEQLSYPLIYNYLTSNETQPANHYQNGDNQVVDGEINTNGNDYSLVLQPSNDPLYIAPTERLPLIKPVVAEPLYEELGTEEREQSLEDPIDIVNNDEERNNGLNLFPDPLK